ncbi:MAG: bifunctional nuclease family protein [Phycisphaerales bacterium]
MAVRMELSRILIRELNDMQLIELREVAPDGTDQSDIRSFPIVIGLPEATAIERRLKGIQIKRPQTHDLLASVIGNMGGELVSITINDLSDHTFFATLDVKAGDGQLLHIDSRPSDAIALGVAEAVPIYVEEHVLEAASKDPELDSESAEDDQSDEDDE